MRRRTTLATAFLLAAACTPRGTDAERRRDAARADSSAAGYAVGPLLEVPKAATPAPAAATIVAAATPTPATRLKPAVTSRRDTARVRKPAAVPRTDSAPASAGAPPAAVPAAVAPAPVDTGPVQDGEFLWYDASRKLVRLRLVAGYSGVNDGLNFNGGTAGTRALVVPLGWRVEVTVVNDDDALSHSALVARHELPVPPEPPPPAFIGAGILSLDRGLPAGESEEMRFTASSAGQFMLVCGVPGHGEGGMWISLEVSGSARVPAYR